MLDFRLRMNDGMRNEGTVDPASARLLTECDGRRPGLGPSLQHPGAPIH